MKVEKDDVVVAHGATRLVCAKIVGIQNTDSGVRYQLERTSDIPEDPIGIDDSEIDHYWHVAEGEIIANLGKNPLLGIKVAGVSIELESGYYDAHESGPFAVSVLAHTNNKDLSPEDYSDNLYSKLVATHAALAPVAWAAQFNVQLRTGDKRLPYEVSERKRLLTVYVPESPSEEYALEGLSMAWGIASAAWRMLSEHTKLAWAKTYADYVSVHAVSVSLMEAAITARASSSQKDFKSELPELQTAYDVWCKHVKKVYHFDNDTIQNLLRRGTWRDYLPDISLFWSEREDDLFGDVALPNPQAMFGRAVALAKLGFRLPESVAAITADTLNLPWNQYNLEDLEKLEEMRENFTRKLEASDE